MAAQLRAIEILLRKCIPDLAAAEIKSEQTHRYVVEVLGTSGGRDGTEEKMAPWAPRTDA
jgi:hypothetical protein